MAEQVSEFEWRMDGKEAEIVLYASDDSAAERVLPAAALPGIEDPVYAAHSGEGFGWAAAARSAAPDLFSAPARGLLLGTEAIVESLEEPLEDVPRLVSRRLSEVRPPSLRESGVRRICEGGAAAAAEEGFVEEEDLALFGERGGDPDALSRRAVSAGSRDWEEPGEVLVYRVGEVLDSERAEALGLERGMLVVMVRIGSGELGRLALLSHRQRILSRVRSGDFEVDEELPAAPADTEEAADLLAAAGGMAGFADARAALHVWALRRALGDVVGRMDLRAAWAVGGLEGRGGLLIHRWELVTAREGKELAAGETVAAATGGMLGSTPPFGAAEVEGRWPWEEAGLLERVVRLALLR